MTEDLHLWIFRVFMVMFLTITTQNTYQLQYLKLSSEELKKNIFICMFYKVSIFLTHDSA